MNIWVIVAGILVAGLLIFSGLIIYRVKRAWKKDPNRSLFNLRFAIKEMNLEKASVVVNRKNIVLGKEDNLLDAIELFLAYRVNVLAVVSGKRIVGVLTKKLLAQKIANDSSLKLDEVKVVDVMEKKFVSCESKAGLKKIYEEMIKTDLGAVAIVNGGDFLGIVDYFDIMNVFLNTSFEMENPPVLNGVVESKISKVSPETTVKELLDLLVRSGEESCIVLNEDIIEGIVTLKDVLSAINKEENLNEIRVRGIMSPRVLCMNPGNYVYEAMKIMVTRRYNQLPIVVEEKVEGVVSLKGVVKAYYEYLFEIEDARNKILVRPISGDEEE